MEELEQRNDYARRDDLCPRNRPRQKMRNVMRLKAKRDPVFFFSSGITFIRQEIVLRGIFFFL